MILENGLRSEESRKKMSDPEPILREPIPVIPRAAAPQPRAASGSPLSMGSSPRQPLPASQANPGRITSPPAPAANRALPGATAVDDSSGLQKAMNAVRMAMPVVQKLLPLIDGSIGAAVANFLAPRPHPPQIAAPKVDLVPIQQGLTELQAQQHSLREQVMEQNTSIKRVEDQLQHVREATDRNTLEQQELLEDLKAFSGKVKIVAFVGLALLAGGLVLETLMFFHLQRVLP
jgi:hypothetical protein